MGYLVELAMKAVGTPCQPPDPPASAGVIGVAPDKVPAQPDPAAEARRARVLAMLAARPEARYALVTDLECDPKAVLLTLAIRGRATCEFQIPREKWDGVLFLELLEQHIRTVN